MGLCESLCVFQKLLTHCFYFATMAVHILLIFVRLLYSLLSFYIFLSFLTDVLTAQDQAMMYSLSRFSRLSNYCLSVHTILVSCNLLYLAGPSSLYRQRAVSSSCPNHQLWEHYDRCAYHLILLRDLLCLWLAPSILH